MKGAEISKGLSSLPFFLELFFLLKMPETKLEMDDMGPDVSSCLVLGLGSPELVVLGLVARPGDWSFGLAIGMVLVDKMWCESEPLDCVSGLLG